MPNDAIMRALSKATSIGPRTGPYVPEDTFNSPLTAKTIPELMGRYGLDPTDLGNASHAAGIPVSPEDLATTLKPLVQGGLERGNELAAELMGRLGPLEDASTNPAVVAFDKLMSSIPKPPDIGKLIAHEKVTGARPPKIDPIEAPAGFKFKGVNKHGRVPRLPQQRSPQISAIEELWNQLSNTKRLSLEKRNVPLSSSLPPGEKPALSGRWNRPKRMLQSREQNEKLGTLSESAKRAQAKKAAKK